MTASIHPSMSTSLIDNMKLESNNVVMSQSLDSTSLNNQRNLIQQEIYTKNLENCLNAGPLVTASRMMPVPESLMSPDCFPTSSFSSSNMMKSSSHQTAAKKNNKGSPKTARGGNVNVKRDQHSSPNNGRKICHIRTESLIKSNKSNHSSPGLSSDEDNDSLNDKMKSMRNKAAQKYVNF